MNIWMIRADKGNLTERFLGEGIAAIGWDELGGFPKNVEWEVVDEAYRNAYPNDPRMRRAINVGQVYRFHVEISEGDIVLTPGPEGAIIAGKVKGPATWKSGRGYDRTRPVDWSLGQFLRSEASIGLQNSLRSSQTVFRVWHDEEVLHLLSLPAPKAPKANKQGPATDPIEAVRQRLLQLEPTAFEQLITYVLESIGFRAEHVGGSYDKGIDAKGMLEIYGLTTLKLHVQAKRFASGKVREKDIRSLRGTLEHDSAGSVITLSDFDKRAREAANAPNMKPIGTIDGRQFVEILTEQYEKVMEIARRENNKEMLQILQFKKMLLPI